MDPEIRIDSIKLHFSDGSCRTQLSFIENELRSVLGAEQQQNVVNYFLGLNNSTEKEANVESNIVRSNIKQRHGLTELDKKLRQVYKNLEHSGLYDLVDMNLQVTPPSSNDLFGGNIAIFIKEKGVPVLKMESFVQTGKSNEVGVEMAGTLRNPFGYGERITLSLGGNVNGVKRDNTLLINIHHAVTTGSKLNITGRMSEDNNSFYTSYQHIHKALFLDYISQDKRQNITTEISFRDEIPIPHDKKLYGTDSSLPVLSSVSPSVKTSMKYSYTYDARDNPALATTGHSTTATIELALPPGNAQFVKSDINYQQHFNMQPWVRTVQRYLRNHNTQSSLQKSSNGLVLSVGGSFGIIYPLQHVFRMISTYASEDDSNDLTYSPNTSKVYLSDRYHSGGPLLLRGFSIYGVGPRASHALSGGYQYGDSIGGLVKTNAIAALSFPIPWKVLSGTNGLLFLNGGTLGLGVMAPNDPSATTTSRIMNFLGYPRLTVGTGLVWNISQAARLEVTYSLPFLRAENDIVKPFQIGVGLSIQ